MAEPKVIVRMSREDGASRGRTRVKHVAKRGRGQIQLLFAGVEEVAVAAETSSDPLPKRLTPGSDGSTGLLDPFVVVALDAREAQMLLKLFPRPVFRIDRAPRIGTCGDRFRILGESGPDDLKQLVL